MIDALSFDNERDEILHHKKNITGIILALAYGEFPGDIAVDAVQFLQNRLYNFNQIYEIFKILIRKKARIKKALRGTG